MSRVLGIDYGLARIGLAISDPERIIAQPWRTIPCSKSDRLMEEFASIVADMEIDTVVIGHPIHLSGDESEMSRAVDRFAERFREKFPTLRIVLRDERLSSVEASAAIRDMGGSPSRDKARIDAVAAALILQAFLESRIG